MCDFVRRGVSPGVSKDSRYFSVVLSGLADTWGVHANTSLVLKRSH